ncbi:hypothetical protein KCP70_03175 [Salmonella enterica subsp. enterica]|nr:hypothetical protein KCP70_03175 [Salmonella enterica subsp. enterica]
MSPRKGEHPESGVCRAGTRHPEADQGKIKALCRRCFISAKAELAAGADINMIVNTAKTRRKRKTLARQDSN